MNKELKGVKSRSFYSVISLLGQSGYSAILGFTAFFVLTLRSGIHLLGIYSTVLAMMSFFNYFTDLGLAAAIMQKKEIEDIDLSTAFIIQFTLTTIAVIIGFFLTPNLFKLYKDLPANAVYLYWAILGSFFLLSLKSVPSVLLEKRIEIYKVVLVQAIENTVFYATIIVLVFMGYDIFSLVVAVMLRSIVGVICIYILNPWVPKPHFSFKSARGLLSYGIPFQGNSFLALIKDDLLVIYLGSTIGLRNLGYVTFGKKYAEFSIRLVMDNINRVAFPLFARFQNDAPLLKKSLHKVLFYETLLIFPIIIGAMFVFDSLLKIIPGYFAKWGISLFSFYIFSLYAVLVSLNSPFINLFNAVGKVKTTLVFMAISTGLIWLFVPSLIRLFGLNGISIGFFLMSTIVIGVYIKAKQVVAFSLFEYVGENIIGAVVMAVYLFIVRFLTLSVFTSIPAHLILSLIGAPLIYFFVVYKIRGKALYSEFFELLRVGNHQGEKSL